MIFIGNDVVNLDSIDNQIELSERYLSKSYTAAERSWMQLRTQSLEDMWMLWSCKESAFKVMTKLISAARFNPKEFEVTVGEMDIGSSATTWNCVVRHGPHEIFCIASVWPNFITTIACNSPTSLYDITTSSASIHPSEDESKAVRQLLADHLQTHSKLNADDYKITKNDLGVPLLVSTSSTPLNKDISFSHDDYVVAFAVL